MAGTSRNVVCAAALESSKARAPPRMLTVPLAPRKARTAWALASVGTSASDSSTRAATGSVRPRAPHRPPAAATQEMRSNTSSTVSSESHPIPNTPSSTGCPSAARRCAAASMTASHSGLRRPGSSPWARTSPPTSMNTVRSRPSAVIAWPRPSAIAAGPPWMSTSTVGRPRYAAIRDSAKNTSRPRTRVCGPGEQDARGELPRAPRSRRRGAGRARVDRPALPGEPTQQRLGVVVEAHRLAGGQGADHVSPAAHPDHQGPARSP